jgi:DNA-binding transcriptional ArsR family regulator
MLELVAKRFRLLGEPIRLRILQALESGERTVNEIVEALEANQSNVSKHLGILYDGGLVARRREGTSVYYFIADPILFKLCELGCRSTANDVRARASEIGAEPAEPVGRRPR